MDIKSDIGMLVTGIAATAFLALIATSEADAGQRRVVLKPGGSAYIQMLSEPFKPRKQMRVTITTQKNGIVTILVIPGAKIIHIEGE